MKSIITYINEAVSWTGKIAKPATKEELQKLIKETIRKKGNDCDLNFIDTSEITDMSELFYNMKKFNGNISDWDVHNVTNMEYMFEGCYSFNQDISKWDVSKVENMDHMFHECKSFNGNLSKWDVSNVKYMKYAFFGCRLQPSWYKD